MKPRKFLYRSHRYFLILLIFLLPLLRNASLPESFNNNIFAYFIHNFGGVYATQSIDMMYLIMSVVPNLFLIYMFSDMMREDCLVNYVYVFTRMGKKQKWLFQKTAQLFLQALTTYTLLFGLSFVIAGVAGLRFHSFDFSLFKMIADIFLLNVLSIFLMIFLQNFLSLPFGSTLSFLFVMLLYLLSLIAAFIFFHTGGASNVILKLLIPSNQMYIWHMDAHAIPGAEELLNNPLNGFRVEYSLTILIIYIIVSYRIARYFFIKCDSTEMMKEA